MRTLNFRLITGAECRFVTAFHVAVLGFGASSRAVYVLIAPTLLVHALLGRAAVAFETEAVMSVVDCRAQSRNLLPVSDGDQLLTGICGRSIFLAPRLDTSLVNAKRAISGIEAALRTILYPRARRVVPGATVDVEALAAVPQSVTSPTLIRSTKDLHIFAASIVVPGNNDVRLAERCIDTRRTRIGPVADVLADLEDFAVLVLAVAVHETLRLAVVPSIG